LGTAGKVTNVTVLELSARYGEVVADAQGLDDVAHELSDGGGGHEDLL
jgi:hypothetical protein